MPNTKYTDRKTAASTVELKLSEDIARELKVSHRPKHQKLKRLNVQMRKMTIVTWEELQPNYIHVSIVQSLIRRKKTFVDMSRLLIVKL